MANILEKLEQYSFFMLTDENMAAGTVKSFSRVGSLMRSKSEGTLIDLDDSASASDNLNGKILKFREYESKSAL